MPGETGAMQARMRSEVVFGYLLQLVSLALLLGQHFLLPAGLGFEQYGRFVFVIGSASLLFSGYDYGYNLLGIKKPRLGFHYLRCKLLLLTGVGVVYFLAAWVLPSMATQRSVVVAILLQALLCVFYTSAVNAELGAGRARRVVLFSLCNGALLLGIPVAFHFAALNMAYAPVVATALSLVFAVSFRGLGWSLLRGSVQSTARRFHWTHFRRSFVKQGQLSFGTIVDAVLVWAGVVIAASAYGFEAGAIYRLVMSAVALLTQVIPMPKQALLRVARSAASQAWAGKYAAVLVLCGALQVAAVYVAGRAGIARAFPAYVEYIYHGVLVLSPVAALKCILEIQTILYDRRNMLSRLIWNSLTAAVPGLVAGLLLDVFWGILAFYLAVVVLSAGAFRLERRVEKLHEGPVQPDDGE